MVLTLLRTWRCFTRGRWNADSRQKNFRRKIARPQAGRNCNIENLPLKSKKFTAVPQPGDGQKIVEVKVELAHAADWAGPMIIKQNKDEIPAHNTIIGNLTSPTLIETFSQNHIDQHDFTSPVARLKHFIWDEKISHIYPKHFSDRVAYGFQHPARLMELEHKIVTPLKTIKQNPLTAVREAAANQDLEWQPAKAEAISLEPVAAFDWLEKNGTISQQFLNQAFVEFDEKQIQYLSSEARMFLDKINTGTGIMRQQEPERSIAVLQASTRIDYQALMNSIAALSPIILPARAASFKVALREPPPELHDAIEGKIIDAHKTEIGWMVYGGLQKNSYDMNRIAFVIDPGGDDQYTCSQIPEGKVQAIIDLDGADKYTGEKLGPASGWLGISFIVDYRGNDHYQGQSHSCGASFMGAGVVIDYQGADSYSGDYWSCGSGLYGTGLLLDLGSEPDVYQSALYSQGTGSAKGFGLLYDHSGNDLYRSNGPANSAYKTPAVFSTYGQGMGMGIRGYDVGGIGILLDQGGNDRYEGGEFSQGGGYFWGLGILHDSTGNDLYYGNRYSHGFGCHQALGVLIDDSGNDNYWSMTAGSMGMAWDLGVGLLLDKKGDDVYQGPTLSMGSASQQSIAWFFDLSGNDFYNTWGASLGMSSDNLYHWEDSECHSFSFFLDAGGGQDRYSRKRKNNAVINTSKARGDNKEAWYYNGIFIDQLETFNPKIKKQGK